MQPAGKFCGEQMGQRRTEIVAFISLQKVMAFWYSRDYYIISIYHINKGTHLFISLLLDLRSATISSDVRTKSCTDPIASSIHGNHGPCL